MDIVMANEGNEPEWRHDVYLCFRGADTRRSFTGSLYNALRNNRVRTFMDDGGLKCGDHISVTLIKAIQDSRIAIVVFSENFASSSWCLEELVMILDYMKVKNQLVFPIFYDVDPSAVRHQRYSYGHSMAGWEERFRSNPEKVQKWKSALNQIASLSGWHFGSGHQYEYELIQRIVQEVTRSLRRYDVFLSFSKADTGYSFTGYLYNTLRQAQFQTFMNDEALEEGEDQISLSRINYAIEQSRLSIIVFSENYAYSSSCLDQLVMMLHCMKTKNQLIWPIFYKVEPSDLRHQRNSYGEAMAAHEITFGKDSEKVHKWRLALSQVANLKGWHFKAGYEYELIERIVENAISI